MGKTDTDGTHSIYCVFFNSSEKLIDAIEVLIQSGIDVYSNGIDARTLLKDNPNLKQKKETVDGIIQFLDRAAREK